MSQTYAEFAERLISTACAGMSSPYDLEQRAITFTVHLGRSDDIERLYEALHAGAESFIALSGIRKHSVTHTGLMAFRDVAGSRYTGAARDEARVHFHGMILVPHPARRMLKALCTRLAETARQALNIPTGSRAIEIRPYIPKKGPPFDGLPQCVVYGAKDVLKFSDSFNAIFLPFDRRDQFSERQRAYMEKQRLRCEAHFAKQRAQSVSAAADHSHEKTTAPQPFATVTPASSALCLRCLFSANFMESQQNAGANLPRAGRIRALFARCLCSWVVGLYCRCAVEHTRITQRARGPPVSLRRAAALTGREILRQVLGATSAAGRRAKARIA